MNRQHRGEKSLSRPSATAWTGRPAYDIRFQIDGLVACAIAGKRTRPLDLVSLASRPVILHESDAGVGCDEDEGIVVARSIQDKPTVVMHTCWRQAGPRAAAGRPLVQDHKDTAAASVEHMGAVFETVGNP